MFMDGSEAEVLNEDRKHANASHLRVGWLLVAVVTLVACGGGDSGGTATPDPANTPPNTSFTVGGSVSGLGSGESLTLRNNGGNDLTLSANGSFTFPTVHTSGSAYAVTVLTQPMGQTCTVSNGSGTVGANISNVAVTCTTTECTQTLSPGANVGAAISSAAAGSTICLSNGNYSGFTLTGVSKNPRVTVQAVTPKGASFTSAITLNGNSAGLTIGGVNLAGVLITSANTRDITFRNADASKGTIEIDGVTHAAPNILFENLEHLNQDNAGFCRGGAAPCVGAGAYHFSFSGRSSPVATIRGAIIDGGCADGIQSGVPFILESSQIKNKFVGTCPNDPHTDAAQLYGGPFAGTIIRGNYFLNNVQVIAAYDGVDNVLIEDNVIDPGAGSERRECQIELYSDANSIIRHNTIVYRNETYPGLICLDKKSGFDNGFGTQIYDNIVGGVSAQNGSTYSVRRNNLVRSGAVAGEIAGSPTYAGGTNPATWYGFQLTPGSLGKGAASSPPGSDVGSTYFPANP